MIKTIIVPKSTDLHIHIPKEYVGKEVEVLLYKTEDSGLKEQVDASISKLRGSLNLTEEQNNDFHQHAKNTRAEW